MPRIIGVDVPKNKRIDVALTYIYGIGPKLSRDILARSEVPPETRAHQLTQDEISKITSEIQKGIRVEGDLRREVSGNIKRLMTIGAYRGLRHRRGLPCRGQRTHTNARTRKGPGKSVGAKRKKT
ncbi:MAG TPA: 30S ribosomal protein S13 [bacterium]|nr:30S ribosomal protein S13 [bacterium]HPJ73141.1 30S ribosomal protein S13 [bacterium]HPQ65951.1 30S ribosomal protein S13 [bacterium]